MIAGGLLVAATSVSYLMLLRADHRAIEDAGFGDAAPTQVAESRSGDEHVAQGSIGQPASAAATATHADAASQQPPAPVSLAPKQSTGQPPARVSATLTPGQAVPSVSAKPPPPVQPSEPPSAAVASVDAQHSTASTANPAQRASRQRDSLERHAATDPVKTSETPETAALVRESAKLDPALPMPQPSANPDADRRSPSAGSNPVAAAMTEKLVRESSSFKPSSPSPKDNPAATR
ncbi:extensin [Burkholderia sp. F1]|uniref:extensin n=1 Tax=Burkholderia sp. F1 TaxID=3366817 RepID=UPI003D761F1A